MHFGACPIHCKEHWRVGKARIVKIDFSAAFDRVNNQSILYKLFSFRYWRFCVVYTDTVSVKPITARYGDGCRSKPVTVVSEVPQGKLWARFCSFCILRSFFKF